MRYKLVLLLPVLAALGILEMMLQTYGHGHFTEAIQVFGLVYGVIFIVQCLPQR
jgi:hypothetical protein